MVKHETDYNYVRRSEIKRLSDRIAPILVFFGSLTFYILTMAPSLFWGKSAVLALNNSNLGINQSPAFPLFTIIGKLFSMIPFFPDAFSANLMSAIFAAVSVMFFYMLLNHLLNISAISASASKENYRKRKVLAENPEFREEHRDDLDLSPKWYENLFPNLMATGLFAVALPVWLSAVRAEVYSLQLALILGAILLTFKYVADKENQKYFYAGLWLYFLSFGNQPLISIALLPAFVFLIFHNGFSLTSRWGSILTPILLFLLAFSLYLYIPFRSSVESSLAYNQTLIGDSFWSGFIYVWQSFNFSGLISLSESWVKLKSIVSIINDQVGLPLLLLWVVGIWGMFSVLGKRAVFFVMAITGAVIVFVWAEQVYDFNHNQVNIQAVLLAIVLTMAVSGVIYLMRLKSLARGTSIIYSILIAAFLFIGAEKNHTQAVLSDFYGPDIICSEILDDLGKNDIVIVDSEDIYYPMLYKNKSEEFSRKIKIIHSRQLTNQQYRRWLVHNYSDLNYDPRFVSNINSDESNLVLHICALNNGQYNIYVQPTVPGIKSNRIEPAGLLFRYIAKGQKPRQNWSIYKNHLNTMEKILSEGSGEESTINFVSQWVFNLGDHYDNYKLNGIAEKLYEKAIDVNGNSVDLRIQFAARLARHEKYKEALKYIAEVLNMEPLNETAISMGQKIVEELENQNTFVQN